MPTTSSPRQPMQPAYRSQPASQSRSTPAADRGAASQQQEPSSRTRNPRAPPAAALQPQRLPQWSPRRPRRANPRRHNVASSGIRGRGARCTGHRRAARAVVQHPHHLPRRPRRRTAAPAIEQIAAPVAPVGLARSGRSSTALDAPASCRAARAGRGANPHRLLRKPRRSLNRSSSRGARRQRHCRRRTISRQNRRSDRQAHKPLGAEAEETAVAMNVPAPPVAASESDRHGRRPRIMAARLSGRRLLLRNRDFGDRQGHRDRRLRNDSRSVRADACRPLRQNFTSSPTSAFG